MTTKKDRKIFSQRFSYDDWLLLCGNVEFLKALDASIELAEVVARRLLS